MFFSTYLSKPIFAILKVNRSKYCLKAKLSKPGNDSRKNFNSTGEY